MTQRYIASISQHHLPYNVVIRDTQITASGEIIAVIPLEDNNQANTIAEKIVSALNKIEEH